MASTEHQDQMHVYIEPTNDLTQVVPRNDNTRMRSSIGLTTHNTSG